VREDASQTLKRKHPMKRGQIIKQTILDKCKEKQITGYTNLSKTDISCTIEELKTKGIILSKQELYNLGFDKLN
jgi:predicted transcriptional regulator